VRPVVARIITCGSFAAPQVPRKTTTLATRAPLRRRPAAGEGRPAHPEASPRRRREVLPRCRAGGALGHTLLESLLQELAETALGRPAEVVGVSESAFPQDNLHEVRLLFELGEVELQDGLDPDQRMGAPGPHPLEEGSSLVAFDGDPGGFGYPGARPGRRPIQTFPGLRWGGGSRLRARGLARVAGAAP
jgi:hypothetical protein